MARLASTSLTFMLVEVPAPAWNTSSGNCSSQWPPSTSSAARTIPPAPLVERAGRGVGERGGLLDLDVGADEAGGRPLRADLEGLEARAVWMP